MNKIIKFHGNGGKIIRGKTGLEFDFSPLPRGEKWCDRFGFYELSKSYIVTTVEVMQSSTMISKQDKRYKIHYCSHYMTL